MVELRTLAAFDPDELERIMPGYTSHEKYAITHSVSADDGVVDFRLQRLSLGEPYVKRWDRPDADTLAQYSRCVQAGWSLGTFDEDRLVGIAIAGAQTWNRSLWIWEFGVAATHRRQGIGMTMMDALADRARSQRLRVMVAETQNTNVPAIRFYRKAGFGFDAIDLSYYTNRDREEGEVALFMKRKLDE
jgi:ribosomal protein S18 acetylase RimI-like enzyme